ncbi:hypothetical protein AZF37_00225 [endosymbiont 'TC1' of Trimyema compressum]|uniref:hypothetical protein n=1 Tax=endosymbiont 'TC1' of Trimyema compressum TaxID=243899 RepID=UPI0007F0DE34|nr:hypothetical protein [endosymbiont 'TC1' of Trimyema compressum]AMP19808.1 hypothetical protein AZF37_00225 [endosymbiont 'TC1' of Trimyema compressum]
MKKGILVIVILLLITLFLFRVYSANKDITGNLEVKEYTIGMKVPIDNQSSIMVSNIETIATENQQ